MRRQEMTLRTRQAYVVTLWGLIINGVLVGLKFLAGVVAGSSAIVADAVHSLSDISTDVALIWGVRAAAKPVDHDHDYGHGKIETLTSAFIGFFLFAVAVFLCWNGLVKVARALSGEVLSRPGWFAALIAVVSVISKEWIFRRTLEAGKKTDNQALIANAWHHRTDALSSLGVFLGIAGAIILGEHWRVLDPLAAITVSIFILHVAFKIIRHSVHELTEGSLSPEVEESIVELASSVEGAYRPHRLRTRRIGQRKAIEMHICVKPDLNIEQGHQIATGVEDILRDHFGPETFLSVHIEPLTQEEDV
ncbi:MAG: cation diffusion facilitator family transporter [Candidatus Omnitrophota bacterium]